MKNTVIFAAVLLLAGCAGGYKKAENAQDAGREFIRASLDGDYKRARFYLLKDSTNMLLIERQKRNYEEMSNTENPSIANLPSDPSLSEN